MGSQEREQQHPICIGRKSRKSGTGIPARLDENASGTARNRIGPLEWVADGETGWLGPIDSYASLSVRCPSCDKMPGDIKKVKAVKLDIDGSSHILRTELYGDGHLAFKAVDLKVAPRIVSGPPDKEERVVVRL